MGNRTEKIIKTIILLLWGALIAVCFILRDKISVDAVVSSAGKGGIIAFFVLLLLFAVKSLTFFIYGGILYAAVGIIFPPFIAVFVNIIGSVIMTSIPFFVGKKLGYGKLDKLTDRFPRLGVIRDVQSRNEFFTAFFSRLIGCVPSDPLGMYFGASGMRYFQYLTGSITGLIPSLIAFTVMGFSINDPTSPEFIIALAGELVIMVASVTIYFLLKRRNWRKK